MPSLIERAVQAVGPRHVFDMMTDSERQVCDYLWEAIARPNQLPPPGTDWFVWLLRSGRGFGKTRTGAEHVRKCAQMGFHHGALVGQNKGDVRDTMVELGESSILKICPPWFMPEYEPSKRRLTFPNGCVCTIYSGDEPGQLRGPQHDFAWVDELAKFKYPKETWDNLEFGLRQGPHPHAVVTTTPRPIAIIKELKDDPRTVDVRGSTFDNIKNLAPAFVERMRQKYENTRLGRQELEGEILDDNPGALWHRVMLDELRVTQHPNLIRVVVGVDPAVTANAESSETGIVVVGLGDDGHGYVLNDLTLRGSPHAWASAAVTGYRIHSADRIVGEVNNGGDMVEHTIRTVDPMVAYKKVVASRGKQTRAEPIAALYEQGRIHHVGYFSELEDQLCEWVPGEGRSPDRLDALVWAITELMISDDAEPIMVQYYDPVEISSI